MNILEQNKEKINGILETFDRTLILDKIATFLKNLKKVLVKT